MLDSIRKGDEAVDSATQTQDAGLISLVRAGDQHAFGILFERHRAAALRVGIRLTRGTRISAEDCVADAFAQTLAALQKGNGPDEFFRAYLYTVMRHAVEAANRADSQSVTVDDFEIIENASKSHGVDPAITRFETEVVRNAFAALPERWQSVLWYSDIEGMKPAEVGPLLGMSSHAVSMLRTRAREGLRTAYLQGHISSVAPGTSCATVASQLGAFSRMSLAKRDRTKVELHLADCADCNAMSAEVKNVNRGLVGIIALIFLGSAGDDLFGGLRGWTTPVAPASVPTASGVAVAAAGSRRGRAVAAVSGSALVVLVITLLVAIASAPSAPPVTDLSGAAESVDSGTRGRAEADGRSRSESDLVDPAKNPLEPLPRADFTPDVPPGRGAQEPGAPQPEVPSVPPVPIPVNLLANGGFDGANLEAVDGKYYNGEQFDGWTIGPASLSDRTLQIWYEAQGAPTTDFTAPFPQGPWARIMGTISQTFPTEVGRTYLLEYETRATGSNANAGAVGWAGNNQGFARIDGVVVDSFVTVVTPLYSPRSVLFTATSPTTELSFSDNGGWAVGIDNVSVKLVP